MEFIEQTARAANTWDDFRFIMISEYAYNTAEVDKYIRDCEPSSDYEYSTKQYLENRQNKQKENNMITKNTECDVKSNTNVTTEIGTTKVAYATRSKDVVGMVTDSYKEINDLIASTVFANTESFKENLQSELRAERAELEKEFVIKELELSQKMITIERDYKDTLSNQEKDHQDRALALNNTIDTQVKEGVKSGLKVAVAEATKGIESDRLDKEVRLEKSGRENKALAEKLRNYSEGMEIDFLFNYFNTERKNLGLFGDSGTKKYFDTILNALHIIGGTW